jgi:O-acetylserine/cysteine efflux transporter
MKGVDIVLNCLVNFIWGTAFTFSGYAMLFFTPILVYTMRFFFGGLIGLVLIKEKNISRSNWLWISLMSLCKALEFGIMTIGMVYLDSSTTSIIGRLQVPFTIVLGAIFLREKICVKGVIGVVISLFAVYVLSKDIDMDNTKYLLLTLLSPLFTASVNIIAKKVSTDSKTKTSLSSFIAGVLMFLYTCLFSDKFVLREISYKVVLSMSYLAIVCGYFGYVAMYYLLAKYDSSKVMPYAFLTPIFSLIGGAVLLGEVVTIQKVVGMIMILSGIIISQ